MSEAPVVLVTGGAVRLGAAIAERFAADGYDVIVHCNHSVKEAERSTARLRDTYGCIATLVRCDLATDAAHLVPMACAAMDGRSLKVLVNSASIFEEDPQDGFDPGVFEAHMSVNLRAPLVLSDAFVRQAIPGASIVNVLDQCVLRPNPWHFSYTLSKAGLHMATKTMALAVANRGVRVNAVAPGLALVNPAQDQEDYLRCVQSLPLRRGGSPEEVAQAVAFLASMPSVTGLCVTVDGGQHLWGDTPGVAANDHAAPANPVPVG